MNEQLANHDVANNNKDIHVSNVVAREPAKNDPDALAELQSVAVTQVDSDSLMAVNTESFGFGCLSDVTLESFEAAGLKDSAFAKPAKDAFDTMYSASQELSTVARGHYLEMLENHAIGLSGKQLTQDELDELEFSGRVGMAFFQH